MIEFFIGLACGFGIGFSIGLVITSCIMITKVRDNYMPGRQDETQ